MVLAEEVLVHGSINVFYQNDIKEWGTVNVTSQTNSQSGSGGAGSAICGQIFEENFYKENI